MRWAVWMGAVDNRYVPGTRIKFSNTVEDRLTLRRSDVLLPLEDAIIADGLRTALESIQGVMCDAAAALPAVDGTGDTAAVELEQLELVECGALVARPGAMNQVLHADFRRDNVLITDKATDAPDSEHDDAPASEQQLKPAMPPRIVAFLYLQDTPTAEHGPTVFLPRTANAAAHESVLDAEGRVRSGSLDEQPTQMATVCAGDAVIYDASVLHFGSANNVAGNERVVFYFGVSRPGAAMECAVQAMEGMEAADPVRLWDYC